MPSIPQLQNIKAQSDRGNYEYKTHYLRELIRARPESWIVDSSSKGIVGLTHTTGFRFHLPVGQVPDVMFHARKEKS